MFIKLKKNKNGKKSIQVVESVRVFGKKNPIPRVVKSFGTAQNDEELLQRKHPY